MPDWDYKMQIECANSFIVPIKNKVCTVAIDECESFNEIDQ